MLMIRYQRIGRTNDPAFRIVLVEKERAAKTGRITEQLGTYNPRSKALTLNEEQVKYWIGVGAQPTGSIHNLLITKGIIEGKKINVLPKKTVPKAEEQKEEPKAETAEEPMAATEGSPVLPDAASAEAESTPAAEEPAPEAMPEPEVVAEEAKKEEEPVA